jgi:hypothetical protein
VNYIGKAVRLPTRFLTGMDELFKQVNYRAYLRDEAMQEAFSNKLQPGTSQWSDFVDNYVRDGFTTGGQAKSETALQMARRSTFTQDFVEGGVMQKVSSMVNAHPWLRTILPFVKVPTNILKTFRDMTPGLNMLSSEFRSEFFHSDPTIAADARGRAAVGSAFWAIAVSAAASGRITGGGPKDPELRSRMLESGWQPYSLVIKDANGRKQYIEYKRYEPLAYLFGMAADTADVLGQQ